jgi:CDP-diacylglycerol---serine O-phosphatidyltransferase
VPPELVLPVFVGVIIFVALLIGYPWYIVSVGSALYLLSLPLGWKSYRNHARKYAAASAAAVPEAGAAPAGSTPPGVTPVAGASGDDRPERLH